MRAHWFTPGCHALALLTVPPLLVWVYWAQKGLTLPDLNGPSLLYSVILAPWVEEYLFRGLIQTQLVQVLEKRWPHTRYRHGISNGLTSVLFCLAHVPAYGGMAWTRLLPSCVLGYLWTRYHRLTVCIATHAYFNLAWLITPYLRRLWL